MFLLLFLKQFKWKFVVKVYDTRTKHYFLREKLHSVGSVIPIPERDPPETGARECAARLYLSRRLPPNDANDVPLRPNNFIL